MAPVKDQPSAISSSTDFAKVQPTRRLTARKVLYHPLTWLAVGFHGLLLFVPFNPGPVSVEEDVEIAEEPEEDAIPIDILNLSDIATATPPAEAPPTATPPAPPSAAVAPAPATVPAPAEPEPLVADEEVLIDIADPDIADPLGTPDEEVPKQPAYDPGQDQTLFIDNLGQMALGDYTADQGLPPANFFREPGNAGYFLAGETPVAGAKDARWMDKGPDAVLDELQRSYAASGITFSQLNDYGGEVLYELKTPTGESFMFISLARLKGSSLLVIWQGDPNMGAV
ncbi:MAG: hypothetical protein AAF171_27140 [Cyanobacteria bacterium P01_A01_bin.116]